MHTSRLRPSFHGSSTYASTIPASQAQALDRRHLLDQQQKAFQGTHAHLRELPNRRRPPA